MVMPVGIVREGESRIRIQWSDGKESMWEAWELRKLCPCATCKEKKGGEKKGGEKEVGKMKGLEVISLSEARPMRVEGMRPVGNYAYAIEFSDGHSSGLFGFALLRGEELPTGSGGN
jgi:DUF971 family protein